MSDIPRDVPYKPSNSTSERWLSDASLMFHKGLQTIEDNPIETVAAVAASVVCLRIATMPRLTISKQMLASARDGWAQLPELSVDEIPKAYKVLTPNGRSPWFGQAKWSLPKHTETGEWKPGDWKEESKFSITRLLTGKPPGINVTWDPLFWQRLYPKGQVFEVEIGDAFSKAHWQYKPANAFLAQRVRLVRPVSADELKGLHRPPYFEGMERPSSSEIRYKELPNMRRKEQLLSIPARPEPDFDYYRVRGM